MSHFLTIVLTETGSHEEVEQLLAPYDENGEMFADGSRWDWWVVGGRWTGWLDGYNPAEDPRNQETCDLCAGTGVRPVREGHLEGNEDELPATLDRSLLYAAAGDDDRLGRMPMPTATTSWYINCKGCNGCMGAGTRTKFSYVPHVGDVGTIAQLREAIKRSYVPGNIVTPDGEWHEQARMGWWGMTIKDESGDEGRSEELWAAAFDALLDQYPDAMVVAVDCHV